MGMTDRSSVQTRDLNTNNVGDLAEYYRRLDYVCDLIKTELRKAVAKHPSMHSAHEGHSVIREELDELWDHVKADTGYSKKAMEEAIQVAAMGVRYVVDLHPR